MTDDWREMKLEHAEALQNEASLKITEAFELLREIQRLQMMASTRLLEARTFEKP